VKLKQLFIAFTVVFVSVVVDCGFIFYQASTGRKLPFKLSIFPRIDGDV
jgi:hypothetical protein